MISCKKATELISKSHEESLSATEQRALQIHLFVCEFCEQFRKHLGLISKAIAACGRQERGEPKLSNDAKQRIRAKLREHR